MPRHGTGQLADLLAFRVEGTLGHLAGGVYRTLGPSGEEQRWLVALLPPERVIAVLNRCPLELPDEAMNANLHPDLDLGLTVVRISVADDRFAGALDEVTDWALGALMVEELVPGELRWAS